jgi:hypothetical protein
MNKIIKVGAIMAFFASCAAPKDTSSTINRQDSDFHPGTVSPRSEERFSFNFSGSQSYSGTNPVQKFDPSDVKTEEEIQAAIRPDSLDKEFASDGNQVNADLF